MTTTATTTTPAPRPVSAAKAEFELLMEIFLHYGPDLDQGRYDDLLRRISAAKAEIAAAEGEAA